MDSWQGKSCTPVTLNKYAYGNASPTMYTDPSGHFGLMGLSIAQNIQSSMRTGQTVGYRATLRKVGKKVTCVAVEQIFDHAVMELVNGIYVLRAQQGNASYVGQTKNFDTRLEQHKKNKFQLIRQIDDMVARFGFWGDSNDRRLVEQFIMNVVDKYDEIPDRVRQNNAVRSGQGGSKNTQNLQKIIKELDFCKD